jgi:hypothetical protein
MERASFSFPLRRVVGQSWCSLAYADIHRIEVVAYSIKIEPKFTFADGHRHRLAVCKNDIHILFPEKEITVDIAAVESAPAPVRRRHGKRGHR